MAHLKKTVILVLLFAFVGVFYVISLDSPKRLPEQFQNDPFYRSSAQLSKDGVTLVALTKKQEDAVKTAINTYYSTTYREERIDALSPESVKLLEDLRSAQVQILSYSQPRVYEDLTDIVGVFALGELHDEARGAIGHSSARLFFFKKDDETVQLEQVMNVGEDSATYESAPVASFQRDR